MEQSGIGAAVRRLPPDLTASGCAYGIAIDSALARRSKEALERAGFTYGKIVYPDGSQVRWEGRGSVPAVTGMPRTTLPTKGGERK